MTSRLLPLHPSNLMAGLLVVLLVTVLAGFGTVMLHILGLGFLPSLWFFSVFGLGFMLANITRPKPESRGQDFKLRLVFVMLAFVLTVLAWRLTVYISVLEVGLYLLIAGFAFGLGLSQLPKPKPTNQRFLVLIGIFSILIFGFLLTTMISGDFAPRADKIKNALTIDERAQLEVLNLQPQFMGFNSSTIKRQLKINLGKQLQYFGLALKNNGAALKAAIEDPATPTHWREILERGGLQAVTENHFLKQKKKQRREEGERLNLKVY